MDEFSLNFPMRNSRLSQAVMASITLEGGDASKHSAPLSQGLTSDSMPKVVIDNRSLAGAL